MGRLHILTLVTEEGQDASGTCRDTPVRSSSRSASSLAALTATASPLSAATATLSGVLSRSAASRAVTCRRSSTGTLRIIFTQIRSRDNSGVCVTCRRSTACRRSPTGTLHAKQKDRESEEKCSGRAVI